MTPHLELGLGLLLGALIAIFVAWGINWSRSKKTFTSSETAKMLGVAQSIIAEVKEPCLIVKNASEIIFANQTARESDGFEDFYEQIALPHVQSALLESLDAASSKTVPHADTDRGLTPQMQIIPLDSRHAIIISTDTQHENRLIEMRRDFITNMSHELKTPISAIGLLSEAIAKASDQPETVQRFSEKLLRESRRLGDLSRDIIKLSEAQSPPLEKENRPVLISNIVTQEVQVISDLAAQKDVKITVRKRGKDRHGTAVIGRESSLHTAIGNLISNALAHSPAGSTITITVNNTKTHCLVSVQDEGPGIDPSHHSRIFERFFRVDESRSREIGGTGLGLSIVRNTARNHGGDVTVRSDLGKGAVFTLSLPLAKEKESK